MDAAKENYALFQPHTLLRSCLEEPVNAHVIRLLVPAKAAEVKPDLNYAVAGGIMRVSRLPCAGAGWNVSDPLVQVSERAPQTLDDTIHDFKAGDQR
jgi:hypothetical protein